MNNKVLYGMILGLALNFSCTKSKKEVASSTVADSVSIENETGRPEKAKYDIPTGMITYSIDGTEGSSIKKVYFEDYGRKEVTEIYREGMLKEKLINKGDGSFYTLDYDNQTAIKRKSSMNGTEQRFDIEEMPEDMKKENNVTPLEEEKILGKWCKAYSMESGGIKTIKSGSNHIALLLKTEMGGTIKTCRATEFKENATVPSDIYDVPAGFLLKEF